MDLDEILRRRASHTGVNLADLTHELPILFVFLRHLGCTFCRETLYDLARQRPTIELEGAGIALVHMSPPDEATEIFERYGLRDIIHVSDPGLELYRAFHLGKGPWYRLFGLKVWVRGLIAGWMRGHGIGPIMGDSTQMPGVFLVYESRVIMQYRHTSPADRPNYVALATFPLEIPQDLNLMR